MQTEPVSRYKIVSVSFGSPYSFELKGDHVIGRFMGLLPIYRVHLGAVHYLRLATRCEVTPLFLALNWPQMLLTSRRSVCPVYILRTKKGRKIFLKMKSGAHFQLRKAIARHSDLTNTK